MRREFEWVPDEAYRRARFGILSEFQARLVLFHTEHFRNQLEGQACENLRGSLDALGG